MDGRRKTNTTVILPAAGVGARLCNVERKAWVSLAGQPLLTYALRAFRAHPAITEIILVVAPDDMDRALELLARGPARVSEKAIVGGAERRDSVWTGLQEVTAGTDVVLIHDAARPFVSRSVIDRCLEGARRHGAVIAACPLVDTVKRAGPDLRIEATVDRAHLWGAQTPQGFRAALITEAYRQAIAGDWPVTDDAAAVERTGHRVHLVQGDVMNLKVTRPEDLALAERLLAMAPPRIGQGYDVHRLTPDRPLVLGGVTIPHTHGLLGHSDADVLTHAIMDALLGAAALGDIGQHFPDTDPQYRGIASLSLLRRVADLLRAAGYGIGNIDATVVAERPKLAPVIAEMRDHLARAMDIDPGRVSVKATTTEGLGFTGTGEGIAAYATAMVTPMRLCE